MSSGILEAKLEPDPCLRRLVVLSGVGFLLVGCGSCFLVPIAPLFRGFLMLLWIFHAGRELLLLRRGHARILTLILDQSGRVSAGVAEGKRIELQLLSGSVVCRHYAWLRVQFPDRQKHAELWVARSLTQLEWHRLQLIWRQSVTSFGRSAHR